MTNKREVEQIIKVSKWDWNDDLYAKIDRQFFQYGSGWHLDPEELYLFVILCLSERRNWSIHTSIHMIESQMIEHFSKAKAKNSEKIVETLYKLANKNVISISSQLEHKKPHDIFYVKINYENYEQDNQFGKWKGFQKLYMSEFSSVMKINHLFIYCAIRMYDESFKGGFKCSYQQWSDLTGFSLSSIKRYIKEMLDSELIYANYGEYKKGSRTQQDINLYRTYDFTEEEKTNRSKIQSREKESEVIRNKPNAFGEDLRGDNPF